jgi:hypothetical protein
MNPQRLVSAVLAVVLSTSGIVAAEHGDKPRPPGGPGAGEHKDGDNNGRPPGDRPNKPGRGGDGPGQMINRLGMFMSYIESKDDDKEIGGKWSEFEAKLKEKNPEEFAKLDANNDGKISRDEAKAAIDKAQAKMKEEHPELFAKIDSNNDGKLSRDELRAARDKGREGRGDKGGDKGDKGGEKGEKHGDDKGGEDMGGGF